MQQKDIRSLAMQIADELCDGGEYSRLAEPLSTAGG